MYGLGNALSIQGSVLSAGSVIPWGLGLHHIPVDKKGLLALAGVAQWIEHGLGTKGSPVQFPVRAHAWVAGQVPNGGHVRGNHTLMFLSLIPPFPSF